MNTMKKKELDNLLQKFENGDCTPEEIIFLEGVVNESIETHSEISILKDCNSQYIICESSRHLQRKEGDGYMQQIIKLKFSCNFINQNARPLQTIQHKMQNPFNQIIAIPSTTSKYSKHPRISP